MRTNRKVTAAAIVTAVIAGGFAAGCGSSSGGGAATLPPDQVLKADGYTQFMTLGKEDLASMGSEGQAIGPYFVSAVAGTKGTDIEAVIQLNDQGAALMKPHLAEFGKETPGVTAHMDGNNLTVQGPADAGAATEPAPSETPAPAETPAPSETPAPPVETAPAPAGQTGPVGTTFTITSDVTGMYGTVKLSVDKVTYGLAPYDPTYDAPASGNQLVGITVSAKAVTLGDPTMSGVNPVSFTALSSDGIGYEGEGGSSDSSAAMMATTFKGEFKFVGQHETGVVAFEMPQGVTVTQVKYDGGDVPVTWTVGK